VSVCQGELIKKVALVFPTKIRHDAFYGFVLPPLGLERIAAHLEDIALVEIFDLRFEKNIISAMKKFAPTIIGINIKTTMHAQANYRLAVHIRENFPHATIVMGGLHATHCYQEALQYSDYVIRGDGELSFRQFVEGIAPDKIAGLCYKKDDELITNPLATPAESLDLLLPPARHLRKKKYYYGAYPLFRMDLLESSRGCTHYCTFCSPAASYPACYRTHSPRYVVDEIKRIAQTGVKFCWLTDDQLGGDLPRLEQICDLLIAEKITILFFAFIRPFLGQMELKRKMAQAGFIMLSYGAESPNPSQLLRYGKNHPLVDNFIANVNREFKEAQIVHIGNSYVFGDPKDSKEAIANIGIFARQLDPNFIEPLYAQPYPGTRYREELKKEGLLLDRPWSDFTEARQLVAHPQLDEEELKKLRVKIWLDFLTPKKFFSQMNVPISLYQRAKISRIRVLLFMKRVEKIIFGCLLEDKIYRDCYRQMVYDYFHHHLPNFPKEEMDFTLAIPGILNLLGLNFIPKWFNGKTISLEIVELKNVLASFNLCFYQTKISKAYALAGNLPDEVRSIKFKIPLALLASRLATESYLLQSYFDVRIVLQTIFSKFREGLRQIFF